MLLQIAATLFDRTRYRPGPTPGGEHGGAPSSRQVFRCRTRRKVSPHGRPCLDPNAQHPHVPAHPELRQDQRLAAGVRVEVARFRERA